MPVNLSIKNVPDDIALRLRQRAARAHRSLQGELMAILERAVLEKGRLTPAEALQWVRDRGLETAGEAAALIRQQRDRR
jgi:plasmid stability protein